MKTTREVLVEARGLVARGKCVGKHAAMYDYRPCAVDSPNAKYFCLRGAIMRAVHEAKPDGPFDYALFNEAKRAVIKAIPCSTMGMTEWYDSTGLEKVYQVMGVAIESLGAVA